MEDEKPSLINKHELIKDLIQPAKRNKRLGNYLIDIFFFYVLFLGLFVFLGFFGELLNWDVSYFGNDGILQLFAIFFLVGYYLFFEAVVGKTIGKMITKTKVVNEDGTKPTFSTLLKRSFSRIIPFDQFSFSGERPRGWHDKISKTMVVDDIKLYELDEKSEPGKMIFEGEEENY